MLTMHVSSPLHHSFPFRAETILSGMLVRPDPSDAASSKVTLLVQNDIKGVLPKAAINYVATKAPDNWRASLSKYFVQEYSKRIKLDNQFPSLI